MLSVGPQNNSLKALILTPSYDNEDKSLLNYSRTSYPGATLSMLMPPI
jgi:hypothetical protein